MIEPTEELDVPAPRPAELLLMEPPWTVGGGKDHVPPVLTRSLKERPAACRPSRRA